LRLISTLIATIVAGTYPGYGQSSSSYVISTIAGSVGVRSAGLRLTGIGGSHLCRDLNEERRGDGGPAQAAQLALPIGLAIDADGNLYIADLCDGRVRKITPTGVIHTVASVPYVNRLAVDNERSLYASYYHYKFHVVRKISPWTDVAGAGKRGFGGDGGPAIRSNLNWPTGIAIDAQKNVYIADIQNHRVRKVTPEGMITTFAGTGRRGYGGDGGPATQAQLSLPYDVAIDSIGNLYIADSGNHRIRKVDAKGTITTIVGTGKAGFSGDGGPATAAQIKSPLRGVAVDGEGNVFFVDGGNVRLRKVTASGTIKTIAGTGESGFGGDGGPATSAQIRQPTAIVCDNSGNIYFVDSWNGRVRKLTPAP